MSEAFLTALFLSFSGGLQDAYTYIFRGGVFANAQTGNIVLLSACAFSGKWLEALRYVVPLAAFALGVLASELIRARFGRFERLHWRQLVLTGEICILLAVGLLPGELDMAANAAVSFSCAMQVQAFRKVDGYAFASTMCIGNLRGGVESLCDFALSGSRDALRKAGRYFGVILLFALGAGSGCALIPVLGAHTIWVSCALLLVGFALMCIKPHTFPEA